MHKVLVNATLYLNKILLCDSYYLLIEVSLLPRNVYTNLFIKSAMGCDPLKILQF